jgi:type III secretion protein V
VAIKLPIPDSIRRNVDQGLNFLGRQRDLMLVVLLISVVALIAAPLPAIILDVLIIINFALSIVVILTAVSIESPLALSSLPSLLLFTTLLRLALNIASTKMILLTGHGPRVVETFGTLVVGGNYVVGAIVFLILSVVQFIVIAKGSERAAEVAARFTLDAMPGKQMAIDADLRAGLITMNEARERRQEIERESKLHGGMDGAMKFVKGDAIAGLVIAAITILGGIGVGVGMKDMSMGEAASRYAVLTIGDSMVAQIPSLLLSVAAGVLITQSGGGNGDGHAGSVASVIAHQISGHPRALLLSGSLLLMSAAVPGFPSLPLIIVAVMLLAPGSVVLRRKAQRLWTASAPVAGFAREGRSKAPPMISSAPNLTANPLTIRLAPNVSRQLTPEQMNVHFMRMRGELSAQLGMPFPGVQMFEATELERGVIEILMYDVRRFSTTVPARRVLIGFNRQVAPPRNQNPNFRPWRTLIPTGAGWILCRPTRPCPPVPFMCASKP